MTAEPFVQTPLASRAGRHVKPQAYETGKGVGDIVPTILALPRIWVK